MKKLLWACAAILLMAAGAVAIVWRATEPGPPAPATVSAVATPEAEAAPPAPVALQAEGTPPPAAPAPPLPAAARPQVQRGVDPKRDPRNDVARPADRRADLLVEERKVRQEAAMDQLNRRIARRKEAIDALGEVRPSAPTNPGAHR